MQFHHLFLAADDVFLVKVLHGDRALDDGIRGVEPRRLGACGGGLELGTSLEDLGLRRADLSFG